ncbi:hypothetical protein ABL78_2843 [Leptomonas seymouri]|uniref:Uncharacterized protein n=1 Tax=Leptomonas seymouri TaxID=5684 RepID=A0A0N0P796_LEPSE|nr:hypothetical protein ABL78_2843 [Leptomonas seymouri]|eukprot:KPI88067.1 hypothetical protein ABL78_2843 [Leptomonas seymouri]
MDLPHVLSPDGLTAVSTPVTERRWSSNAQRERCEEAIVMVQNGEVTSAPLSDALQHVAHAAAKHVSGEEFEPTMSFGSRNQVTEVSSFGVSISTCTPADGCSVSTMPIRWLKTADAHLFSAGSDCIEIHRSPLKHPSYVFERAAQLQVVHSKAEESAMMHAAAYFAAAF